MSRVKLRSVAKTALEFYKSASDISNWTKLNCEHEAWSICATPVISPYMQGTFVEVSDIARLALSFDLIKTSDNRYRMASMIDPCALNQLPYRSSKGWPAALWQESYEQVLTFDCIEDAISEAKFKIAHTIAKFLNEREIPDNSLMFNMTFYNDRLTLYTTRDQFSVTVRPSSARVCTTVSGEPVPSDLAMSHYVHHTIQEAMLCLVDQLALASKP